MSKNQYYFPRGGLPTGEKLLTGKAVFKDSYVIIPREVMTDIVTSYFPNWKILGLGFWQSRLVDFPPPSLNRL